MASSPNISPYPLQFDPSQWSNQYSPFQGVPLPSLAAYAGVPTDALGNPIASYQQAQQQSQMPPSTTLNSNPLAAAAAASPSTGGGHYVSMGGGGQFTGGGQYQAGQMAGQNVLPQQVWVPNQAPAAATPPPAPTPGPDMNQAYLAALSNPGKVQTPGATVPQAPLPSGQSGVLQSFLQNWQNKGSPTTGAGNYNNSGFFNALQGGQPSANPS
jgi:hypothetical protein